MKDFLLELAERADTPQDKMNVMREYLQLHALHSMAEQKFFMNAAFVGGTALRFIYGLPRFSEDLDFSLIAAEGYNFKGLLSAAKRSFEDAAYSISIKLKEKGTVHSAFLKFPEVLHMAGITWRREQNLSIKLDVDTNPPPGAIVERTLITKYFPIMFAHHDLPSLFAGKLHAIITRPYLKGRDYFDLAWIMSHARSIEPNFEMLNNALKQTGAGITATPDNWKDIIRDRVEKADWDAVLRDVLNFAEDRETFGTMKPENFVTLLK